MWSFDKNTSRENVIPKDHDFVHTDTFGLTKSKDRNKVDVCSKTCNFPHVACVLSRTSKT